jgi:hypothetical protein
MLSGGFSATTTMAESQRPLTPIRIPRPLKKTFAKKDIAMQGALAQCVRQLRLDPRHPSLRTKRLQGRRVEGNPVFEARVTRGDRLTFYWDGETIVVENHCNHDILKSR